LKSSAYQFFFQRYKITQDFFKCGHGSLTTTGLITDDLKAWGHGGWVAGMRGCGNEVTGRQGEEEKGKPGKVPNICYAALRRRTIFVAIGVAKGSKPLLLMESSRVPGFQSSIF
jgi:hypothetical protein